jgi:hypothetical protein
MSLYNDILWIELIWKYCMQFFIFRLERDHRAHFKKMGSIEIVPPFVCPSVCSLLFLELDCVSPIRKLGVLHRKKILLQFKPDKQIQT